MDKNEEFMNIFEQILVSHPQIRRIRIEGEKTNIVVERDIKEEEDE